MKWKLYVLECSDGSLYTGITTDTSRRLDEHNCSTRGAKYTRSRRPVKMIWTKAFKSRSAVSKAESRFKKLSRSIKLQIISGTCKWNAL